ncbi:dual specificity mitogen-activated protein kinase kinase 4 isoform X4 [Macrobrachium rosenbergii]|uniref:dual specificity mitogen-activated protein kinase kinase 4 isoform X4 n=1 Tax=Macrobrachium rosenbergii TaxID=79674 RepID=UPI0034D4508E
MADQQHPPPSRPGSLNMPAAIPGRRSNLRLAFPSQGRQSNDRPSNNLDFPASGYPTTQMHTTPSSQPPPPPPPPPPRSSSTNASKWPAALPYASTSHRNLMVPTVMVSRAKSHDGRLIAPDQLPNAVLAGGGSNLSNSNCSGRRTISPARHQSLSPARSPQNMTPARSQQNLAPARPRNLSLGGLQNSSGEIQNFPCNVSQNQSTGSQINMRDQKKKHLVLHLPPPHNHPHHHHNQHHRHGIHHDGLRERGHKSSWNVPPVPQPPRHAPREEPTLVVFTSGIPTATTSGKRHSKLTRGIYQNIQSSGKLKISPEVQIEFTADDLRDLGEIGRGGFGTVNKMVHRKSNTIMAVKRIRSTVDEKEQKQLLMDLEVVMRSNDCPCIVQFYGAIFKEGDCWICMELMDTSLDKFYKFIYERLNERLPENILGKITVATLTALNYLKEKLKIIHRDVKPSNILLDKRGNIKLCDFGISGQLVDSIAKTRDAGCRPYMAPERIDPARARGYDVRSDVWSLGITLMELATGSFPYPKWNSVFEQLTQVVQGEPPRLSPNENGNTFSEEFVDFVNTCLIKEESSRPKYKQLLEHEFVIRSKADPMDVAEFVCGILDKMANNGRAMYTYDSYNC